MASPSPVQQDDASKAVDDDSEYSSSSPLPASVASPSVPPETPESVLEEEEVLIEKSETLPDTNVNSKTRVTRSGRTKTSKAKKLAQKEAKLKTKSKSPLPDTGGNSKKRPTRPGATKSVSKGARSKTKKGSLSPHAEHDSKKRSNRSRKAPKELQRSTKKKGDDHSTEEHTKAPRGVTLRPSGRFVRFASVPYSTRLACTFG